ncbi:Hypothetical protein GLP15_805 [Giardia lamblia P15]|uniref:Uncharacterized protein n=1 Tax=Giardia intestinalis (strain P15) TaxID=658858 RepID=E1EXU9_GIAIA|nr:Hypothetical protein GLP15_805 [Giardia lamblia P15]
MDLFADGANLHRSFHCEKVFSKPRKDGVRTQSQPFTIKQFPRSFGALKEWANSSTTLKIVRPDPSKPNDPLPEPPQLSYSMVGKPPTILSDRSLLKFELLATQNATNPSGQYDNTLGQQLTRMQRYTDSLEQRRRVLIDSFLQYIDKIFSSLYIDFDRARMTFQDYLSDVDARFLRLVKEPGVRPHAMNASLQAIEAEVITVFTKLRSNFDNLASMLRGVVTDAIKTLSVGLGNACCTGEEILVYIGDIIHQVEERITRVCMSMLMFITSSHNRALLCMEDGKGLCRRVIHQRKMELVHDFIEQYMLFIHQEHEFSPVMVSAIQEVNLALQQFSSTLFNFITDLSIRKEHPRDIAVRLVKTVFLPRKQDVQYRLEELKLIVDDVYTSLAESTKDVLESLQQLGILSDDLRALITETLSYWRKRWDLRLSLIEETLIRTVHANSFFIACIISLCAAADMTVKHATLLEDNWRKLCDDALKAIEERFARDWSRSTKCLEYISTRVKNVWDTSEAQKIKQISKELLDALEHAIIQREEAVVNMTNQSSTGNKVLRTLLDVFSLELKESAFSTLFGTIADKDDALLSAGTLFNSTLVKNPVQDVTADELVDHNTVILSDVPFPTVSLAEPWSCAEYQITELNDLIGERNADIEAINRLMAANALQDHEHVQDDSKKVPDQIEQHTPSNSRLSSKASNRAPTPNQDKKQISSKNRPLSNDQTTKSDTSSAPRLLLEPPDFDKDVDMKAYISAYGFSYFQDAATPAQVLAEFMQLSVPEPGNKDKDKGKQVAQVSEQKPLIFSLVTPRYQQVLFSKEVPYDKTYVCVFMNLPADLRLILYYSLLRLLYKDGERIAYNRAVSDFKDSILSYRSAYLQKLNSAAMEAYASTLADWEKEAAKKAKAASKSKTSTSRPESRPDGNDEDEKPVEPVLATQLPDYVEAAIAGIKVPDERPLDEFDVYLTLVYTVLDFEHLKMVPLAANQDMPVSTNPLLSSPVTVPPPSTKDSKKAASQSLPKSSLLKGFTKSPALLNFEKIVSKPKYSVSADELMFNECVYDGARDTLMKLKQTVVALSCQRKRPATSVSNEKRPSSKNTVGNRQSPNMSSQIIEDSSAARDRDRIDELLTLARPCNSAEEPQNDLARSTGYRSILSPTSSKSQRLVGPPGVLGSSSATHNLEHQQVDAASDIIMDCRSYTSSDSLAIKLVLGNISTHVVTLIMSRLADTYSGVLSHSMDNIRRILTISDDLRTSLVPYTVKLLHSEIAQIESRCSKYVGVEYRTLNRAMSTIVSLRKRILDATVTSEVPVGAVAPSGSRSASGSGARAPSRGKQAVSSTGETRLFQEALTLLSAKRLDRFVELTFDSTKGIVTSLRLRKQLSAAHPLFKHTESVYEAKFNTVVNENILLFPEQADRTIIYACDAFIAECKVFLRKNLSTLIHNDISSAERITQSFTKQAIGWSGLDSSGPFDFAVADLAVSLLRNNYGEVQPLLDTTASTVKVHPAIAASQSLLATIGMLREEAYSRLHTDLLFFKHLMQNVSQAVKLANSEYSAKVSTVEAMKKKCTSIKTIALNRLFLFKERMNVIREIFTQTAKCPNKTSLNSVFSNTLSAIEASFELEQIAYYLSYTVVLQFIFYPFELSLISKRHTFLIPYDLFKQRSKAFNSFAGVFIGAIVAVLNILCSATVLQTPFTYQEEIRERSLSPSSYNVSSTRSSSSKRLVTQQPTLVSRTIDLHAADISELPDTIFSKIQQFFSRATNYEPGMKAFYNTSIECDICTQLQTELAQMFSTYALFQPIYVPRDDEMAAIQLPVIEPHELNGMEIVSTAEPSKKDSRSATPVEERIVSSTQQIVLPTMKIKRLKDSSFRDELSLLQYYYREAYDSIDQLITEVRTQLHELLVQRDKLFDTLIKQFSVCSFEITYRSIERAWKVYKEGYKDNRNALSQKFARIFDSFRPALVNFPEKALDMQQEIKVSLSEYRTASQSLLNSLNKDMLTLLSISNCLLVTVPAILLSLYPSWANDNRVSYCASLQISELLSFLSPVGNTIDGSAKTQASSKKRPASGISSTVAVTSAVASSSSMAVKLLGDEQLIKTLIDSCVSSESEIKSCSAIFVQMMQHIEVSVNSGKAVFEAEPTAAFPTANQNQPPGGKAKEAVQTGCLQSAILPSSGLDFTTTEATQLEIFFNTFSGKSILLEEPQILSTLTCRNLDNILQHLLKYKAGLFGDQTQHVSPLRDKDKKKQAADSKKPSGATTESNDAVPPPVIYYRLGHVTLPLTDSVDNGVKDGIFTRLPEKVQLLIGCSYDAVKMLLKSLKNSRRLNSLASEYLAESARMEQEANEDIEHMKAEFKQAFTLLNNPKLANFAI